MEKPPITSQRVFSLLTVPDKLSRLFIISIVNPDGTVSFASPTEKERMEYKRCRREKKLFLQESVTGNNGLQLIRLHENKNYKSPFASVID